jgi:hypothetical protein
MGSVAVIVTLPVTTTERSVDAVVPVAVVPSPATAALSGAFAGTTPGTTDDPEPVDDPEPDAELEELLLPDAVHPARATPDSRTTVTTVASSNGRR